MPSYFLLMFVAEMSVHSNSKRQLYSEGRMTLKSGSLDSSLKDSEMSAEVPLSKNPGLLYRAWTLTFDLYPLTTHTEKFPVTVSAHMYDIYLWIRGSVTALRLSLAPTGLNETNLHVPAPQITEWLTAWGCETMPRFQINHQKHEWWGNRPVCFIQDSSNSN